MTHRKLGTGASCRNQVLCLGIANSSVRPLNQESVGGRECGSTGTAPTWLTALHDASEPPQALVASLGIFPAEVTIPARARRRSTLDRPKNNFRVSKPLSPPSPTRGEGELWRSYSAVDPAVGCIRTGCAALSPCFAGHTPTTSESGNPASPAAQKALDRRRRFTLIRLGTFSYSPRSLGREGETRSPGDCESCGGTRSGPLAEHVNWMPRDGRGAEAVNHFSRLPAG